MHPALVLLSLDCSVHLWLKSLCLSPVMKFFSFRLLCPRDQRLFSWELLMFRASFRTHVWQRVNFEAFDTCWIHKSPHFYLQDIVFVVGNIGCGCEKVWFQVQGVLSGHSPRLLLALLFSLEQEGCCAFILHFACSSMPQVCTRLHASQIWLSEAGHYFMSRVLHFNDFTKQNCFSLKVKINNGHNCSKWNTFLQQHTLS